RGPRRAVDEPAPLARDLLRVLPVRIDRPDVPQAVAIARDRDALAVGAEAGLHVEGRAAGDARRLRAAAPADRHYVDVAEQIEDDALAVGADVDVHPRAFGRVEGQLFGRPEIGGDVPFLVVALRTRADHDHGERRDDTEHPPHPTLCSFAFFASFASFVSFVSFVFSRLRQRYQQATVR